MTVYEFERILFTAKGYLQLEMPAEALEAIEQLPYTRCRLNPEVIAVRLLIAKLKRWELGVALLAIRGKLVPASVLRATFDP